MTGKKGYQPQSHEDRIYQLWEESGFFNPDVCREKGITDAEAEPYSIVLPPPNATGTLHTGHASMLAIEDVFVRFNRMQGKRTLWLPGTDHAAIATQVKVETQIFENEGKTRFDLGREEFLNRVRKFVDESRSTIVHQCRKMGASLDWSREAFTLDDARHQAVNKAFKQMYDDGIIYRGDRIVNWDPQGQTTISDDEIVYREETTSFYYLKYGPFTIGTARPETKLGDKYIVMHPDDTRYADYQHGQTLELEWINGPVTATIIKDESIDPDFGTGVMTITPWHSTVDFEIAERHNLDKEQIIDLAGKLLPVAQEFAGMSIQEAREKIVEKLDQKGLVEKIDTNYIHQVATAERTGATIEPQIMRQWFVDINKEFKRDGKTQTLKTLMQEAIRTSKTKIVPERFEKIYFHWIDNLRPWCISRQLWYGHRIPVWYKGDEIYCGETTPEGDGWEQDPDTLDTWFSSGLWTFSTLGWGSDEKLWEAQRLYHPTSLMETGYDILFFWVARMILMSTYLLDEVPFKTVYLHGLVRDEEGRKMSKSLGNIINPLDLIEQYGTDALRLALLSGNTPGNDMRLGDEKLTAMRNFINKLYNISRYVQLQEITDGDLTLDTPADHLVAQHLHQTREVVIKNIEEYNLSVAIDVLQEFTTTHLADTYIEIYKSEIKKNNPLLQQIFQETLVLWHPFIPFVTEVIYQDLYKTEEQNDLLMVKKYSNSRIPQADPEQVALAVKYNHFLWAIRVERSNYNIPPISEISFQPNEQIPPESIIRLAKLKIVPKDATLTTQSIPITAAPFSGDIHIDNADIETKRKRLQKELLEATSHREALEQRLANKAFMNKAPENIRQETKRLRDAAQEKESQIKQALENLNA